MGVHRWILPFALFTSACAAQMPPVFLSHVLVVVDPVSYKEIVHSNELGKLAAAGEMTVEANLGKWTAFYITCHQTIIEILAAERALDNEPLRVGRSGIGLGFTDKAGGREIEKRLRKEFGGRVSLRVLTHQTRQAAIPWFSEIDVDGGGGGILSTWFYELSPGFLIARYPGAHEGRALDSQQYFAARPTENQLLDDVVGITLALNPGESSLLAAELGAVGWTVNPSKDRTVVNGPGATISLIPPGGRNGIQEI